MVINTNALRDAVVSIVGERGFKAIERSVLVFVFALAVWALIWQLDLTVNGLLVGSVYALGAVGLSLVYGNLHLPNIAHGDYMTLGAFVALFAFGTLVPEVGAKIRWTVTFSYTLFIACRLGSRSWRFSGGVDQLGYRRWEAWGVAGVHGVGVVGVAIALRGFIQYIWGTRWSFPAGVEESFSFDRRPVHLQNVQVRCRRNISWRRPAMFFAGDVSFLNMTKVGQGECVRRRTRGLGSVTGIDVNGRILLIG